MHLPFCLYLVDMKQHQLRNILLFKYVFMMGPKAIWLAMSLSNLFTAIYGYILFRSGKWKGEII